MSYFLRFNINQKANPLVMLAQPPAKKDGTSTRVDDELGDFILMIEGFHMHAAKLSKEEAGAKLIETRKACQVFYDLKATYSGLKTPSDERIKDKIKYAIKALNRLEALLHLNFTSGNDVERTPDHIKQGLAQISNDAIAHRLSKE